MSSMPDVVIKNGRIVPANTAQHTRIYAAVAIVATLVATGLGGYIMGQSSAKPPAAPTASPVSNAGSGSGATAITLADNAGNTAGNTTNSATSSPVNNSTGSGVGSQAANTVDKGEAPAVVQSLQAAVSASLTAVSPNSDNEKKFVQAQQDYLRQTRETPEQVKARLDQLAADPKALAAHNQAVTNRVVATAPHSPGTDLSRAVQAAQTALPSAPKDAMTGALKAEAAVREAEGKTYVVRPGDTLWAIAQRLYGDPYQYKRLFEANPRVLAAPEHIFPGQVLRVPA